MFSETAALYDLIYGQFKDYEAETAKVAALLNAARPGLRSVLDVACGTGEHARLLREQHGLAVDGIDLEPAFIEIAQRKNPSGRFVLADMCDFDLGRQYDAVICLFSSIGYLRPLDRVRQAIGRFRAHAAPGGVIIVEPWLTPDVIQDGYRSTDTGEQGEVRVVRHARTEVDGRESRLHFEYDIVDHGRAYQTREVHELGLYATDEMRSAFEANDLAVDFDPKGLIGRGLYVAHSAG